MNYEVTPEQLAPAVLLIQLVKWYAEDDMDAVVNKLGELNETETCEQLILALSVMAKVYLGVD